MWTRLILIFTLFSMIFDSLAAAEVRILPAPFKMTLGDNGPEKFIFFCASEQSIIQLFRTRPKSLKEAHRKTGCGGFFVPIEVLVIPVRWTSFSLHLDYVAKIRDNYEQEAFVIMKISPQFAGFSLGKKVP